MAFGTRWMTMPGCTRPARPRRCHKLACEAHCMRAQRTKRQRHGLRERRVRACTCTHQRTCCTPGPGNQLTSPGACHLRAKQRHAARVVKAGHGHAAAVDDDRHVVDGDGALGDVCGQDDLAQTWCCSMRQHSHARGAAARRGITRCQAAADAHGHAAHARPAPAHQAARAQTPPAAR